jgi:hypothetical protein
LADAVVHVLAVGAEALLDRAGDGVEAGRRLFGEGGELADNSTSSSSTRWRIPAVSWAAARISSRRLLSRPRLGLPLGLEAAGERLHLGEFFFACSWRAPVFSSISSR